ncbi:hypothetical protein AVENP_1257 [Arcobacter venerupis]|uniref:Hydrogenase n=1 Tax=Arcobacter venerupis TaxID=1054033 RepID=A0AAE7B824_9BACT|nr:hypothetical protein [Arcobacter venerupis]QKF66811.1 hypothetical protein AVENP_1257 [Arcobacter venerupis]RWS49807.1 hypothetical protein CKA56_06890 [Arcobacter venerupis]
MVLKFEFTYKSKDKTLAKFLDFASKQFDCSYKILQEGDFLYLYVESSQEILTSFSDNLSLYLPMSIYFYGLKVEVIDSLPLANSITLAQDKHISFCPECLKKVEDEKNKDYYNAFKSCDICSGFEEAEFIFEDEVIESNKPLFEKIALLISENKKIKIKTLSGIFVFSKLENIDKSSKLLVTNLENISSLIVENKTEIIALASIEKPFIDFKINEIYKQKNSVKKDKISIRFANDLTLLLLSKELEKYNIDFLNIEENTEFDYFLDVKSKKDIYIDIPKIKCFENKKLVLESNSYPKKLDAVFEKFQEKNKAQFMSVLWENRLFSESILNFYISSKNSDGVSYYSEKIDGLVDILEPLYIPKSIKEIFEEIQKDTKGKKLISNYKEKFPEDYKIAINTAISFQNSSFYTYFQIAKIVLNFQNNIVENAMDCLLEKGPRIDYKLFDSKKLFHKNLDYLALFKSALSFKLAGVDEQTISLGFMESLANFIGNEIDNVNSAYEVTGVSLCGDMFENERFNLLVEKSITKNFKIYYNKEFVIQK